MATWQDRMTSQRVRNEVRRGREVSEAGRKEEKRRKKGGKRKEEKQSAKVSSRCWWVRASVLGPGAGRGPVAHGRGRVLVSGPDGMVQNPAVWGSSQGLVVAYVLKHENER